MKCSICKKEIDKYKDGYVIRDGVFTHIECDLECKKAWDKVKK